MNGVVMVCYLLFDLIFISCLAVDVEIVRAHPCRRGGEGIVKMAFL